MASIRGARCPKVLIAFNGHRDGDDDMNPICVFSFYYVIFSLTSVAVAM